MKDPYSFATLGSLPSAAPSAAAAAGAFAAASAAAPSAARAGVVRGRAAGSWVFFESGQMMANQHSAKAAEARDRQR